MENKISTLIMIRKHKLHFFPQKMDRSLKDSMKNKEETSSLFS